ncbi:MAG: YcbK family protein [Neptuniibacter sp.]
MSDRPCSSRRKFLKVLGGSAALTTLPKTSFANIHAETEHHLSLLNLHTGESIASPFYHSGTFDHDGINALNYLLRDHRNDQVIGMDTKLLMLLHDLQQQFNDKQIHVISAYRSPATNEMLRRKGHKVAKRSYHLKGQAIDIRIPGVDIKDLHKASLFMRSGGVGLYTRNNFVHVDVGPVRSWGT